MYLRVPTSPPDAPPRRFPFLTVLAVLWCIGVYLSLTAESPKKDLTYDALSKWGLAPGPEVWGGRYWALFTSVFVHLEWWHVTSNCCWLMWFGTFAERGLGKLTYFLFFAAAAFVSSSFQLAALGETGYGASGVVYALFGLLLPLRKRWREVNEFLYSWIIVLSLGWLVVCIVLTRVYSVSIGNAAHVSGMTFGLAVGFVIRGWPRRLALTAIAGHLALAGLFLVWCPWQVPWLTNKAYQLHASHRYADAVRLYTRIIEIDPKNSWAYHNRASAYQSLGRDLAAASDLETATKLDAHSPKPK